MSRMSKLVQKKNSFCGFVREVFDCHWSVAEGVDDSIEDFYGFDTDGDDANCAEDETGEFHLAGAL